MNRAIPHVVIVGGGFAVLWFRLAAHVFFLIGFRHRVGVLLHWVRAYWTYQRGACIVLGQDALRGAPTVTTRRCTKAAPTTRSRSVQ